MCMSNSYYNKYVTAISKRSDKYNIENIVNYNYMPIVEILYLI